MSGARIPSFQQQADLAERVHNVIGRSIEMEGRRFSVSRHGNEIRFHGQSKFRGENGPDAYVQVLRDDLATIGAIPREYRDRKAEARALEIVRHVLKGLS